MAERRGRPVKEIGKKNGRIGIRIDNEDRRMLAYLADKTGQTKTEILKNSLKMYYNLEKYSD